MAAIHQFQIALISKSPRKVTTHDLEILGFVTPNSVFDAINRLKTKRGDHTIDIYDRISFKWGDHEINLTNPAKTGRDPEPYFDPDSDGYKWTKEFLGDYFKPQEQEKKKETEPEKEKKDDSWKNEPLPGLDGATKGSVFFTRPESRPIPEFGSFQSSPMNHRDYKADWETRWNDMMSESQAIEAANRQRLQRHYEAYKPVFTQLEEFSTGKVGVLDVPKAILRLIELFMQAFVHLVTSIPEEIRSAGRQFWNNITFIGLSIERLFTIISSLFEIINKSYIMLSQLDWEGAIKLLNMLIDNQKKALEFGIENKIFDEGGLTAGPENWQIPSATAPNDAETLKFWQAVQVLADSPFLGAQVRAQLRFWVLQNYQQQTGVGIPNTDAWIKYVLDQQIGTSVPIQEAMDMAGQIPQWFLSKTRDMEKIAKQVHKEEHKELKQMKK